MVDLDLKEIVHELGDAAWCEGKNFEDWVEPRVNAILQALDERDALKADVHGWEVYVGKLLGSLPLGDIIPASSSLKDFSDRLGKMVAENYSLRNEVSALKAELDAEKENHRLHAAKLISEKILVSEQLEAARKQEPIIIRTMEGFEFLKTYEIGTKLYASPVPPPAKQEPIVYLCWEKDGDLDYTKYNPIRSGTAIFNHRMKSENWEVMPVYASPVPAQQSAEVTPYIVEAANEVTRALTALRHTRDAFEIGGLIRSDINAICDVMDATASKLFQIAKGGENER